MPSYKGRPSAQSIARDFPHVVEIAMPAGGLGKRLDAMHEFHARRGIRARNGPHRRHNKRDFISLLLRQRNGGNVRRGIWRRPNFAKIPSSLMPKPNVALDGAQSQLKKGGTFTKRRSD
jgi:hypothetical protein